jgi:flagellar motor switch/type III secretory pathway protein FliN
VTNVTDMNDAADMAGMSEEELEAAMLAAMEAEEAGAAQEAATFPDVVQVPKLVGASPAGGPHAAGSDFAALMDLQLPCYFELGATKLSVAEVLGLQRGSVIQLEKMMGEPGKFVVGDREFAKAEVVQLSSGHYGIRITQMVGNAPGAEGGA